MSETKSATRSLERGLMVLEAVAAAGPEGLRFSDFTRRTGLPKMTVTRLLRSLVELGYLERLERGRYGAGRRLRTLSDGDPVDARLRREGAPVVRALAERVGESAVLLAWDGTELRGVVRELVQDSVVLAAPGHRIQWLSGHPFAVIGYQRADLVQRLRQEASDQSPEAIELWWATERQRLATDGYAKGEQGGRLRVAAPVHTPGGKLVGALMVGCHPGPGTRNLATLGPAVATAARQLAARL